LIQKDHIERLTQQVAKVLARLIGKDWEQTLLILEAVYNDWLPIKRKDLIEHPPKSILDWLIIEEKLSVDELEAIAHLLQAEGNLMDDFIERKDRLMKALLILEYVDNQDDTYSMSRKHKIDILLKTLSD